MPSTEANDRAHFVTHIRIDTYTPARISDESFTTLSDAQKYLHDASTSDYRMTKLLRHMVFQYSITTSVNLAENHPLFCIGRRAGWHSGISEQLSIVPAHVWHSESQQAFLVSGSRASRPWYVSVPHGKPQR